MTGRVDLDVLIVGGGVAGLWALGRLRAQGYRVWLVESDAIGNGQTRYAQGIIHGGTKYLLTGEVSESAAAVAHMPALWQACLQGEGELDLSGVKLLSRHQYLWSSGTLGSRMAGFFAGKLMHQRARRLPTNEYPQALCDPAFKGQVFELNEPVLDTISLVNELSRPHRAQIKMGRVRSLHVESETAVLVDMDCDSGSYRLSAQRLLLTAGSGNERLLQLLGRDYPRMQRRPLRMVLARGPLPEDFYAHCMGASINPRVTVTSHRHRDGQVVWYLGGQLAEDGVRRSDDKQIHAAKKLMRTLLPWLPWQRVEWACLQIDRAELAQSDGSRPDDAALTVEGPVLCGWPTKLVLAPRLAEQVVNSLRDANIQPVAAEAEAQTCPPIAEFPWNEVEHWT